MYHCYNINSFELVGYINPFVKFSSLFSGANTGHINDKSQGNDNIDITD